MGTKSLLVLVIAFFAGLLCCFGIAHFYPLEPPPQVQPKADMDKVIVAKVNIPAGMELTAELVSVEEVPFEDIPLGAISRFSDLYGKKTLVPIPAGKPIDADFLFDPMAEGDAGNYIPPGYKYVPIMLAQTQGGKTPEVEQAVDLILQPKVGSRSKDAVVIAENLKIQTVETVQGVNGRKKFTISLLLNNEQSKAVSDAAKDGGRVQVVVRVDESVHETDPVEIFQPEVPGPMQLPAVSDPGPAYESRYSPPGIWAQATPKNTAPKDMILEIVEKPMKSEAKVTGMLEIDVKNTVAENAKIALKPTVLTAKTAAEPDENTTESASRGAFASPPRQHYGTMLFRPRAME